MSVFLDTSFLYALISGRDQWHHSALAAAFPVPSMVTSSQIVSETVSLLQVRNRFPAALDFLNRIRSDSEILIIYPDTELQRAGWDLLNRYGGTGANAVDCTSFAIMHSRRIHQAYTFDAHFHQAGFRTLAPPRLP
jgi:uncharacterized protein